MKIITRLLAAMLLLLSLSALAACQLVIPPSGDSSGTQTPDGGNGDTGDGTSSDEELYVITFIVGSNRYKEFYKLGEMPVPPTCTDVDMGSYLIHFTGWETEMVPVTGDATYTATYEFEFYTVTATFVMGDTVEEVEVGYGVAPEAPSEIPDYLGMKFLCWDKTIAGADEDVTYTAVYYDDTIMDEDGISRAYKCALLAYSSKITDNDNANSALTRATALYTMVHHEHLNPQGGALVDRIVAHFQSVTDPDQAPCFDAICLWSYCPLTAAIALARTTPTVWDALPIDVRLRLDTMMKAYIYLESFATSDYNYFQTGPGLTGNFYKTWNPNYRLANVPVMVFATYYFGRGDVDFGAEQVNSLLLAFDEDVYDNLVNTFQRYGWRRAFKTWTTEERTTTDGTDFTGGSAKELLCNGGEAVGDDTSKASDLLVKLGYGVGVNNGGKEYKYMGFTLDQPEQIILHLINYNYGGSMKSGSSNALSYKQVVSDHWYDTDGDSIKERVAWIVDETLSPYEGEYGMMTEFASGNRSSTSYCSHDFVLATIVLSATAAMELYEKDDEGEYLALTDDAGASVVLLDYTADEALWRRIQIGNEDFIYKFVHGYKYYATGSYGTSSGVGYETSAGTDYRICKSLWRTYMMREGTVEIAESFG